MNKWVGITLGAATAYGIVRYLQMQNVSDQTNITLVEPRVHKFQSTHGIVKIIMLIRFI